MAAPHGTGAPHRSWGSVTCTFGGSDPVFTWETRFAPWERDSTPTPGLREQQGPPWDGAPRAFSLSQDVLIGHGPKGQETAGHPFPWSQCRPSHQAKTDRGPLPAAVQPGTLHSSANWESPLKILGWLSSDTGVPCLRVPTQPLGVPLFPLDSESLLWPWFPVPPPQF